MRTKTLFLFAALTTATFTAACDSAEPAQDPTFEAIVQDIFAPSCTFSSCHTNPTIAGSLDLTPEKACDTLVNTPSCLFPDRMRIVPGHPEDSFFFHKLSGQGLDEAPTGSCGTQTNLLMPFGASALPDHQLALVHDWIAAGASCTGTGGDKTLPVNTGPAIASLTASTTTPLAGQMVSFTVTLDKAAPEGGQKITLDMDQSAMSAPVQLVVPAASTSIRFEGYPLRPTSRFALRAHAGPSTKDIILRVTGLEIAEVLADPIGDDDQLQWVKLHNRSALPLDLSSYRLKSGQGTYDHVSVPLTGTIPAGGCVVIGGPIQSGINSEPIFSQLVDFSPNLAYGGSQVTGFSLFDGNAPLNGAPTPVDTMLVGATNDTKMLGPDAEIATPSCSTPVSGMSALRTGPGTCAAALMQPRTCL
jgi:hypothetical protein